MGSQSVFSSVTMQFLIVAACLSLSSAQLVNYLNGAVAPYDANNAAATKAHFAALAEAGAVVNPYGVHPQGLAAPVIAYHGLPFGIYGRKKREAQVLESDGLVTYPNGARAPYDPNVALATANHYAAKAAAGYYPYLGAANVHPAAYPTFGGYTLAGRKKRDAEAQVIVPYAAPFGYSGLPYYAVVPFVAHPNGALVPLEPVDVIKAREEHLAAVAEAGRKKRSADAQIALPYTYAYGYAGLPYLHVVPFVAHPNGAFVPLEPADVIKAREEHLAAHAEALNPAAE